MINFKTTLSLGLVTMAAVNANAQKAESFKPCTPNIVLILMDDMGYGDIGRTGATFTIPPISTGLQTRGCSLHATIALRLSAALRGRVCLQDAIQTG